MSFNFKNKLIKNFFTLLTGTLLTQIIPLLISPILTRVYTPAEFGVYALYISISSVLGSLSTLKLEPGLVTEKDNKLSIQLFKSIKIIIIIISSVSFIFIFLFMSIFTHIIYSPLIDSILFLISILLTGQIISYNFIYNRFEMYSVISKNKVIQSFTIAFLNLFFGVFSLVNNGLIISNIIGQLIALNYLMFQSKRIQKSIDMKIEKPNISIIKKHKDYIYYNAPSSLLNMASIQLPVYILSGFFSNFVTGQYSLVNRVLKTPVSIVGSVISQLFFKESTKENVNIGEMSVMLFRRMLIIAIIPTLLIFFQGDNLFRIIFGGQWEVAGEYSKYLVLWIIMIFVSSPLTNLYNVLEKQKVNFTINIIFITTRVLMITAALLLGLSAKMIVILFGLSGFVLWIMQTYVIFNLLKIKLRRITYIYIVYLFIPFIVFTLIRGAVLL